MIAVDWMTGALGAVLGAGAGVLFFGGLAWGMRRALRRVRPAPVLLLSAGLRIAALMVAGWWIAGHGAVMLAGFAAGFMGVRFAALAWARRAAAGERA